MDFEKIQYNYFIDSINNSIFFTHNFFPYL